MPMRPVGRCTGASLQVMESWEVVLKTVGFDISVRDVRVYATDTMGFVTCVEIMEGDDRRGR